MKRSIYLDFTIPIFLTKEESFKYSLFLKSLIKNIEKTSNIKFYISINIFNEFHLLDSFKDLVRVIKALVDSERAEIVLSSSFNLTAESSIPATVYDLMYSEYFSGYYMGLPRDFEGDDCVMMKNLHTVFSTSGSISSNLIDSMKLLGLERLFVSQNLLENNNIYQGIKLIPIDLKMGSLFQSFITLDSINDFLSHSKSSSIFYLNVYQLFHKYSSDIETNMSNLLYLFDKASVTWDFTDIDDENIVYEANLPSTLLEKFHNISVNSDKFQDLKKLMVTNISHSKLSFDNIEDYLRSPLWKKVSLDEIDSQNMFNLNLMILQSSEIEREKILLNEELRNHVNDIIDSIVSSNLCSKELETTILTFKDKLNQK